MTAYAAPSRLIAAYKEWLKPADTAIPVAVSLNYRAHIKRTPAVLAAQQFWQRVDCAVHGSKVKRKGMRVPRACMLEGDGTERNYHYHAMVELPEGWTYKAFSELLLNTWESLREAGRYTEIALCYDASGWMDYICKDMKISTDVLCLATSHRVV